MAEELLGEVLVARQPLVDAVDVVKVDLLASGVTSALELSSRLARQGVVVVAEKVEDPALFDRVVAAGADLVQGFFFTRPRAVRGIQPQRLSAEHLALLEALTREESDLAQIEDLIRRDLTLADRFLRLVDVATGWRHVESLRDGLIMLGQRTVHRWATLLVMSTISPGAPHGLMTTASVRARYLEEIEARRGTDRRLEAFCLGMFSVLGPDGLLEPSYLDDLPVTDAVRDALAGRGELRPLLELQLAVERADWEEVSLLGKHLGLEDAELATARVEALRWAEQIRISRLLAAAGDSGS